MDHHRVMVGGFPALAFTQSPYVWTTTPWLDVLRIVSTDRGHNVVPAVRLRSATRVRALRGRRAMREVGVLVVVVVGFVVRFERAGFMMYDTAGPFPTSP